MGPLGAAHQGGSEYSPESGGFLGGEDRTGRIDRIGPLVSRDATTLDQQRQGPRGRGDDVKAAAEVDMDRFDLVNMDPEQGLGAFNLRCRLPAVA